MFDSPRLRFAALMCVAALLLAGCTNPGDGSGAADSEEPAQSEASESADASSSESESAEETSSEVSEESSAVTAAPAIASLTGVAPSRPSDATP